MKLWRHSNKLTWWVAFFVSTVLLPLLIVLAAIGAANITSPVLYFIGLLLSPIAGCYLLAIARTPLLVKVVLILLFFCSVLYALLPVSTCGGDGEGGSASAGAQFNKHAELGCNG